MSLRRYCPSCLASVNSSVSNSLVPRPSVASRFSITPFATQQTRSASQNNKQKSSKDASQKKKKTKSSFDQPDLKDAIQFSLVDAMRYIRAAEVGYGPKSAKYELHMRLRTTKNGAVIRNRLRLPHPVKTDQRICVICPPDSDIARSAIAAGASVVGEESVFEAVKEGRIEFERCIAHADSVQKLAKANVARILGPRGLMPSAKMGTVTKDVANSVRDMVGGSEYRERSGVLRVAIGQLGFTPEEMQNNIRTFVEGVKKDIAGLADRTPKEIHEVVLSSTHGPGFSLSGDLRTEASPPTADLATF